MTALTALTERVVLGTVRDLDLLFAFLAPAGIFIGFTVVAQELIDPGGMNYPQYVLPAVVIQAILLGTLTTAERAARDHRSGFGVRLQTMPISALVPLAARMLYCVIRGTVVLLAAIGTAYFFGFRMNGGFLYTAAFVLVALLVTLAVSLGADATGSLGWRADTSTQMLLIPQLLVVLLSTGIAPADTFPGWMQPFVTYQPVSQVTETLRGLAEGRLTAGNLAISSAWCLGLLLSFGAIALKMQRRPQ